MADCRKHFYGENGILFSAESIMAMRVNAVRVGCLPGGTLSWSDPMKVGGTLSRRDPMKVAQHFSAGLAFCDATRPGRDDRSPLAIDKIELEPKDERVNRPYWRTGLCAVSKLRKFSGAGLLSLYPSGDRCLSPIQPLGSFCDLCVPWRRSWLFHWLSIVNLFYG
jgi:hypothetical protein